MNPMRFPLRVWRRFVADHGLRTAAALAYTTLLSLVPLLAVALAIFSAFPAFHDLTGRLQELLFETFVPGTSEAIIRYLQEFSSKAAGLSTMGLLFLLFTALSLISTIDSTLNQIWRVPVNRPPWLRFVIYWTVLTLGPLLVGMGLAATTYLMSLPLVEQLDEGVGLRPRLLSLLPLVLEGTAFTLLYALVPVSRVPLRHALSGGLLAGLLFEGLKHGFAYYVTHFPTQQQAIYGAFASFPLFLLWIYISWVVVLLGAEWTCALGEGRAHAGGQDQAAD